MLLWCHSMILTKKKIVELLLFLKKKQRTSRQQNTFGFQTFSFHVLGYYMQYKRLTPQRLMKNNEIVLVYFSLTVLTFLIQVIFNLLEPLNKFQDFRRGIYFGMLELHSPNQVPKVSNQVMLFVGSKTLSTYIKF